VSVYLNGTSIHTTTDASGNFELSVNEKINTDLIISRISYHMVSIPNPFDGIPDIIYLTEKDNTLDEIVVVSDGLSRKKKLKMFKEQFLGADKDGKSCVILNEDDIDLFYNAKIRRLSASSENPIIIENKNLGYRIQFSLINFYVDYAERTLFTLASLNEFTLASLNEFTLASLTEGTTSFMDLKPNDKKYKARRDNVYYKSSVCFFKNFINNTLADSKFRILNDRDDIDIEEYFEMIGTPSLKRVSILPDTDIKKLVIMDDLPPYATINILYNDKDLSRLVFVTDTFLVDRYGNTSHVNKLLFSGHMGDQRVGNMLPLDYKP